MDASESGIILPGGTPTQVPVDPKHPERGMLTPVMDAKDLTQGVLSALAGVQALGDYLSGTTQALRNAVAELADIVYDLAKLASTDNMPEDELDVIVARLDGFTTMMDESRQEAQGDEPTPPEA